MTSCAAKHDLYPSDSDWKLVSTHKVHQRKIVYTGTTNTGKPKYYIRYRGGNVYISEDNYRLFKEGEVTLYIAKSRYVPKDVTLYRIYSKPINLPNNEILIVKNYIIAYCIIYF